MSFYRSTFPTETITPKLHMLGDHAVPFIKRWGSAFGVYGEQGIETLHAEFNRLNQTYCRMGSSNRRLDCMMKEYMTRVHPEARALKPAIKRRKKEKE